jgi:hypothetical protein
MPRITTHAIPLEVVQRASRALVDELAALTGVSRAHFTIEVRRDPFVLDGEIVAGDPFVEIAMFARGEETEDAVAQAVTRHLAAAGAPAADVYVTRLEKRRYYEDGKHF